MSPPLVVAVAYDGLCTFEFGCVVEVFGLARPELDVPWYRFAVHAADPGPLRAAGGLRVSVDPRRGLLEAAHTIVVPGWRGLDAPVPPRLVAALRRAHARGARLASICSGVFVLAATGLLDGREATTHWRYADALARRFPAVRVRPDALYVEAGRIVTAAGSAAGLDMMLHLVRRDHGARIANRVAQRLVMPPHRDGGQAQFVPRPLARTDEPGRVAALIDWLRRRLGEPHTVASLAARAAMSPRSLQRAFVEATGQAPYAWLVRERVAWAKELLESPRANVGRVAQSAGFGSEESLRRHFRRIVGTSPSHYRRQFARAT